MDENTKTLQDYIDEEATRIKKNPYLQYAAAYYKARKRYNVEDNIVFSEA